MTMAMLVSGKAMAGKEMSEMKQKFGDLSEAQWGAFLIAFCMGGEKLATDFLNRQGIFSKEHKHDYRIKGMAGEEV